MPAFIRLSVFTAVLAVCSSGRLAEAQDSEFRSNAAHTGVFSGPGASEFHKLKWKFHTKAPFISSPVVSGDTVYVGTPNYESAFFDFFYNDMIEGVSKMMSTGAVLSSPAVAGDTILFGSTDGTLYAIQ